MPRSSDRVKPEDRLPVEELLRAAERIGDGNRKQLEWVLSIINDKAELSAGRLHNLRVELGVFRGVGALLPHLNESTLLLTPAFFPTEKQARQIYENFSSMVPSYAKNQNLTITCETTYRLMYDNFSPTVWDLVNDCGIRLMKLLAEFSSSLRRCPDPCGNWFLKGKMEATYCSKNCGTTARMAKFRKRANKDGEANNA